MTQRNNLAKPDYPDQSPQAQAGAYLPSPQEQIDQLRSDLTRLIENQHHNGNEAPRISLETDISGLFETVSSAPTGVPNSLYSQIKVYTNSTTYRLYWYDAVNHAWHYVTATA